VDSRKGIALFAALKKEDVVWLKKNSRREKKIGMPVKWLEAEEIDKSFTSNIRMVESYPNKAAASMLSD
jgi:hypothetical protein